MSGDLHAPPAKQAATQEATQAATVAAQPDLPANQAGQHRYQVDEDRAPQS